jgi:hypothetical protein
MRVEVLKRKTKTALKTVSGAVALLLSPLILFGVVAEAGVSWYMENK